jgi:hypothetical protein
MYSCTFDGLFFSLFDEPLLFCSKAAGFETFDDPNADTFDVKTWDGSGMTYSFDIDNGRIVGAPYGP